MRYYRSLKGIVYHSTVLFICNGSNFLFGSPLSWVAMANLMEKEFISEEKAMPALRIDSICYKLPTTSSYSLCLPWFDWMPPEVWDLFSWKANRFVLSENWDFCFARYTSANFDCSVLRDVYRREPIRFISRLLNCLISKQNGS